jgi:hypothetical protein
VAKAAIGNDRRTKPHAHADSHTECDTYRYANPHRHTECNAQRHSESYTYTYTYRDIYTESHRHNNSYTKTYADPKTSACPTPPPDAAPVECKRSAETSANNGSSVMITP